MNIIPWWRTVFGKEEIKNLISAVEEEHISMGPVTEEFETLIAHSLKVPYCVATTSGSVALLMSLMALGIKSDDEVIVPNRTWIATAHAPLMLGAKVILTDVQPDLPIMDISQIRQKITSRTRAIIPVPLNGRSVDMRGIQEIADEFGLYVIEDAAQSLFSKYSGKYIGTISDIGCFSLSVAKLLSTGQGGLVVTNNEDIYKNLIRIRTHGVDDVINCTYFQMGFNFRFTDLQSSFGLAQLNKIKQKIDHLMVIYTKYEKELKQFPFLKLIPVSILRGEIPLYIEVLCENREKLVSFLALRGIQTRPFYPNLNYASHLEISGQFPNSDIFDRQGLILPCGPDQPLKNVDFVIKILQLFKDE